MSYNDYERFIKENLSGYAKEIDDSDMWSNIEPHLPQKKKQRYMWIFLLSGASILLLGYTLIGKMPISSNSAPFDRVSDHLNLERPQASSKDAARLNYIETQQTNDDTSADLNSATTKSNKKESNTKTVTTGAPSKMQESAASFESTREKKVTQKEDIPISLNRPSSKDVINEGSTSASESKTAHTNSASLVQKHHSANEIPKDLEDANSIQLVSRPQAVDRQQNKSLPTYYALIPIDSDIKSLNVNYKLPALSNERLIQVEKEAEHTGQLDLNIHTEYSVLIQQHIASSPENETLAILRNSLENTFESLSIGANLEYKIRRNISISGGVDIYRYQTGSFTTAVTDELRTALDTIALIQTNSGPITELGDRLFNITKTQRWRRITTSTNISIPLIISYHKDISPQSNISLGLGYRLGISTQTSGYEQELNATEYNLGEDSEDRLRTNGQNHGILSINWNRRFKQKTKIAIGLRYLYDISGIYNSNVELQKKLHQLALRLTYSLPLK